MERHRYFVQIVTQQNGRDYMNTNQQWETVVECRTPNDGKRMVEAQYGGEGNCRVTWRGRA